MPTTTEHAFTLSPTKYILTQKKLYKKTDAIFSIYGKNGINHDIFF